MDKHREPPRIDLPLHTKIARSKAKHFFMGLPIFQYDNHFKILGKLIDEMMVFQEEQLKENAELEETVSFHKEEVERLKDNLDMTYGCLKLLYSNASLIKDTGDIALEKDLKRAKELLNNLKKEDFVDRPPATPSRIEGVDLLRVSE